MRNAGEGRERRMSKEGRRKGEVGCDVKGCRRSITRGKDFYQAGLEEMKDTRVINGMRWTRDDKRG